MPNKPDSSSSPRLSHATPLFVVALALAVSLISGQHYALSTQQQLEDGLTDQARALAQTINPNRVVKLTFSPQDLNTPEHPRLCSQFRAYAPCIPEARWIYLMAERNGAIVFGPDSLRESDPDYSPPGDVYTDAPAELTEVFRTGQERVVGPYADKWGKFVSVFFPLVDPRSGRVIAVLGIDVNASRWAGELFRARELPLLFSFLLLICGFATAFTIAKANRSKGVAQQRWRVAIIVCSGCFVALLSAFAAIIARQEGEQSQLQNFKLLARVQTDKLDRALRTLRDQEESVAAVMAASEDVSREEFRGFTKSIIHRGLALNIMWIPKRPDERHEILYIEPAEEFGRLAGFDLDSEPAFEKALGDAERTGLPTSSDAAELPGLHATNRTPIGICRVSSPPGMIAVSLNLPGLFETLHRQADCEVGLFQMEEEAPSKPLAATHPEHLAGHSLKDHLRGVGGFHLAAIHPVFVFGKCYAIVAHPTTTWLRDHAVRAGWITLALGLSLSALIIFFITYLLRQPALLQKLVEQRTAEMRASEAKYRTLFQSNHAVKLIVDPASGALVDVNSAAEKYYGWSREELTGMKISEINILTPGEVDEQMELARRNKRDYFEFRHRLADGSIRDVEVFSGPIVIEGRHLLYCIVHDITDRIEAEKKIKRLNRLHTALSRINEAVVRSISRQELFETVCRIMTDVVQFKIAWIGWVDQATGRIKALAQNGDTTGYLQDINITINDEPAGRGPGGRCIREGVACIVDDFMKAESTKPWREDAAKAGIKGSAVLPIREQGVVRGELTVYAGEVNFFGQKERQLIDEAAASVSYALDFLASEAKAAKLLQAIERSPASIVITDREGLIEYVNPKFTQATGYTAKEAIGQNPRILKSGDTTPEDYRKMWTTLMSGNEWRGEFHNKRKDGSLFWEAASLSPMKNEKGEITHFVAVKEDITDKKNAEAERARLNAQLAQAQKMDSIGRLAGGIAHDFNNLLQAIQGFAEILASTTPPDDPRRADMNEIVRAADRASSLTRQLLAFSRQQALAPKVLNLGGLIKEFTRMLNRLMGENIRIELKLDPTIDPVLADRGQIEQVLMNLAVNARDAITGQGVVALSTRNLEISKDEAAKIVDARAGKYVALDVEDTGSGIPAEVLPRIFDPFFTTKEKGQGTGLGLSVAYGIVRQHQGFIQVSSEPGRGTRFTVALPAHTANSDKNVDAGSDTAADLSRLKGGGESLLIIEDESGLQDFLRQIMRRAGYRPMVASNLEEARAGLLTNPDVQLVLSDVILPDGNGLEFALELRERRPGLKVILASGYAADRSRWPEIERQGFSFLQKPYTLQLLLETIQEQLRT